MVIFFSNSLIFKVNIEKKLEIGQGPRINSFKNFREGSKS